MNHIALSIKKCIFTVKTRPQIQKAMTSRVSIPLTCLIFLNTSSRGSGFRLVPVTQN